VIGPAMSHNTTKYERVKGAAQISSIALLGTSVNKGKKGKKKGRGLAAPALVIP